MLKLYNSLTREIEDFKPIDPSLVTMYTCGPTVYNFAHIGNFRTYTMADVLVRTLQMNGYDVKYVMNLTDVGHLTGDNLGDADTGEDRMEKSARKEGKTAWEIAEFYTDAFLKDFDALHLTRPELFAKATDHIKEQIELVERLEEKGYTYQTSDGIYFDTSKFPQYGQLSNLDEIKEGARVEVNPEKKSPRDFALWKFSYPNGKSRDEILKQVQDDKLEQRQMEWDSPWGIGFPGWHIECSAMSLEYLTDVYDKNHDMRKGGVKNATIDIHAGGMDLRETHHPNEIAQSEAATGKKFVNYWMHSAFMLVAGERMSKSLGNNYRLYDLEKEHFEPLALRYLYLQTHYRQEMNFTFSSLEAAQTALNRLRDDFIGLGEPSEKGSEEYEQKFLEALNDDLNTPKALAVVWELLKSTLPKNVKAATITRFDEVLGLDLKNAHEYLQKKVKIKIPQEVQVLIEERQQLRKMGSYGQADQVRNKIRKLGFDVQDTKKGTEITKLS